MSKTINDKAFFIRLAIVEMQCAQQGETARPEYAISAISHLTEYFSEQIKKGNMRPVNPKTAALVFYSYAFYVDCVCKINGIRPDYEKEVSFSYFMDIFMTGVLAHEPKANKR
jgi:hypothetical protein